MWYKLVLLISAYSSAAALFALKTFVISLAKNLALAYVMEKGLAKLADIIGGDDDFCFFWIES